MKTRKWPRSPPDPSPSPHDMFDMSESDVLMGQTQVGISSGGKGADYRKVVICEGSVPKHLWRLVAKHVQRTTRPIVRLVKGDGLWEPWRVETGNNNDRLSTNWSRSRLEVFFKRDRQIPMVD